MTPVPVRQHHNLTLGVLVLSALAFALTQTMVAPALPAIQHELDTSATAVTWVLTVFLLTASIATPIVGRLGDMFGKHRVLLAVLGVFGIGSLVAALSHSVEVLILGRAIQGVAGAIFPLSFGIIRDEFPRERVATGIGLISATFGIGGGAGLVLSGVIVDNLNYEWIFWLALIVIVIAAVATHFFVPESPVKTPAKIDWIGAALLSGTLVSLLVGVSEGNGWGWGSAGGPRAVRAVAVLAVLLGALRAAGPPAARRHADDARPRRLDHEPDRPAARLRDVRLVHPHPAARAAAREHRLRPRRDRHAGRAVPAALVDRDALRRADRRLARRPLRLALPAAHRDAHRLVALRLLAVAHTEPWEIYVTSALFGVGIGLSFAAMANLIVEAVPQTQTGVATGMNTIMRTIGGSIGGSIAASIVAAHLVGGLAGGVGLHARVRDLRRARCSSRSSRRSRSLGPSRGPPAPPL